MLSVAKQPAELSADAFAEPSTPFSGGEEFLVAHGSQTRRVGSGGNPSLMHPMAIGWLLTIHQAFLLTCPVSPLPARFSVSCPICAG